jgi:GAF domain-containing protein
MVNKTLRKAHEAEREQFLAETTALYNGSRAIANALSERQIFEAVFEQICLEHPAEILAFRFELVHDEPIWADVRVTWSEQDNPTYPSGTRLYLPDTPHSRLLTTTEPLFIENVATDTRLSATEREGLAPTRAVSMTILPLTFISHELGSIIVYFTEPRTFSEVTCRFWLALTDQAAVALNNRHLIQDAAYRAVQMETAAEVTRAASSLIELRSLLKSAAALIQDRFEFYYVGIYLVDNAHEWAELRAGTGEAGRFQIEEKYRLKIDDGSIIGWSIHHRKPFIALDVGKDAVHFQYPHLPKTRSEMALPLIYRNQVIGGVTVQLRIPGYMSKFKQNLLSGSELKNFYNIGLNLKNSSLLPRNTSSTLLLTKLTMGYIGLCKQLENFSKSTAAMFFSSMRVGPFWITPTNGARPASRLRLKGCKIYPLRLPPGG